MTNAKKPKGKAKELTRNFKARWSFVPDVPEDLLQAAKSGRLALIIGAGFSRQASRSDGSKPPTWSGLLHNFLSFVENHPKSIPQKLKPEEKSMIIELIKKDKYLIAADFLRSKIDDGDYDRFLDQQFSERLFPSPVHKKLKNLKIPFIATTNFDTLLEDTFDVIPCTQKEPHRVTNHMVEWSNSEPPLVFKIHGTISDKDSIIFTQSDFNKVIYRFPSYSLTLKTLFLSYTVLMIGYSMSDPEITNLFSSIRDNMDFKNRKHYILVSDARFNDIEQSFSANYYGVFPLVYSTYLSNHPEIGDFLDKLSQKIQPPSTMPVPEAAYKSANFRPR